MKLNDEVKIAIIGILIAIVIGITALFPNIFAPLLQPWINIILISILILSLIIILHQKLYQYIKKLYIHMRNDRSANKFFQEFRNENFVDRAIKIMPITTKKQRKDKYGFIDNIPQSFFDIMDQLKKDRQEFANIPNIVEDVHSSISHFNYWNIVYKHCNKKKSVEICLLGWFSFLIEECTQKCILRSLRELYKAFDDIKIEADGKVVEGIRLGIDEEIIKNLVYAKDRYDEFRKDYNRFVRKVDDKFRGTMSELPLIDTEYDILLDKIRNRTFIDK